jgi:hypothetical protein
LPFETSENILKAHKECDLQGVGDGTSKGTRRSGDGAGFGAR